MVIGKRYQAKAYWQQCEDSQKRIRPVQTGVCVYVHPKKRFCTLEFQGGIRASFTPGEIRV